MKTERETPVGKKKKSGSETRARKIILPVRLTAQEHATITAKAEAANLSAGGFLRACGLGRVTPGTKRRAPADKAILERAIAELRRVGNNINQIARAANMNEPMDSVRLDHALKDYEITLHQFRKANGR
jgi:hypothetical protein